MPRLERLWGLWSDVSSRKHDIVLSIMSTKDDYIIIRTSHTPELSEGQAKGWLDELAFYRGKCAFASGTPLFSTYPFLAIYRFEIQFPLPSFGPSLRASLTSFGKFFYLRWIGTWKAARSIFHCSESLSILLRASEIGLTREQDDPPATRVAEALSLSVITIRWFGNWDGSL